MNKEETFLEAYRLLCLEHGFQIIGCGECGSAWLEALRPEEIKNAMITWLDYGEGEPYSEIHFANDNDMRLKEREK